jgi:WD40 repeat protein
MRAFSFQRNGILILCILLTVTVATAQTNEPIQIGELDGATLNSDGSLLLTWSQEGIAKIIDTFTGQEKLLLEHGDSLLGATWNADGSRILTWSADNILVWNAQNGNQLLGIKTEDIIQVGWLSTSRIFAWSEYTILIWDAQSGDEQLNIDGEGITGVSISGDGATLIWWKDNGEALHINIGNEEVVDTDDQSIISAGELTAADIISGKWQVTWGESLSTCAQIQTTSEPRPFIMLTDPVSDTFSTEDIFIWSLFNFVYRRNAEGEYVFLRNQTNPDGTILTFEYVTQIVSPTRIEGIISDFATGVNCTNSQRFILTLVDESITCMVGSIEGANSRSGPGTTFNRLNPLLASTPADVVGQATGDDNLVWWKLADSSWVRQDVVIEVGDCENVPQAQP